MKKLALILTLLSTAIILLILSGLLYLTQYHSTDITNHFLKKMTHHHPFKCKTSQINLRKGNIKCSSLEFRWKNKKGNIWSGKISEIQVYIEPRSLFQNQIIIKKVFLKSPQISLNETIPKVKIKKNRKLINLYSKYNIRIKEFILKDGSFEYSSQRETEPTTIGKILINNIKVQSKDLHIYKNKIKPFLISSSGNIGDGQIFATLYFKTNKHPSQFEIKTQIREAPLNVANSYIEPLQGITIKGQIIKADGESHYDGEALVTQTMLNYKDLYVDLKTKKGSTDFETWLKEQVFNMILCDSKKHSLEKSEETIVKDNQKTGSWAQLVLTGLLKSSLKGACFKRKIKI